MTNPSFPQTAVERSLEDKIQALKTIIAEIHWMARRYADGRSTYAPSLLNQRTREALMLGVGLRPPHFARDGMGRSYDGLTPEEVAAAEEDMPRGHMRAVQATEERTKALVYALAESIKLQSHYAVILNGYDGGKRLQFASVEEWLTRLESLKGKDSAA